MQELNPNPKGDSETDWMLELCCTFSVWMLELHC